MAKKHPRSGEDLAAASERARADRQFMAWLDCLVERDREILDWLAGEEHRRRLGEGAGSVRQTHGTALHLGDTPA